MLELEAEGASLHGCVTCGGVWLDDASTQRVLRQIAAQPYLAMADHASQRATIVAPVDASALCPHDGSEMGRKAMQGVDVDICALHGAWFDAGEVRALTALVEQHRRPGPARASSSSSRDSKGWVEAFVDSFFDIADDIDNR